MVDRARVLELLQHERDAFAERNPASAAAHARAGNLFGRVPMTWMNKTAGGFPLFAATARGAHLTDLDGHEYADFSLGDTAAMAGHSPAPVVAAVERQLRNGLSLMAPTEDAAVAGAELARRSRTSCICS